MQTEQEQYAPPAFDQSPKQTGDILVDGADIGIDIGEIARQKKIASALADATAATEAPKSTVEMVEKRLEYVPLPQQMVHMWGMSVLNLRKPDENKINIFDDSASVAPYLYDPKDGEAEYIADTRNTTQQTQSVPQDVNPKEASWKGFNEQSF